MTPEELEQLRQTLKRAEELQERIGDKSLIPFMLGDPIDCPGADESRRGKSSITFGVTNCPPDPTELDLDEESTRELREMVTRFVCERLGKRVEIARRELAALQIHPNGPHAPERPESPVEPR